MTCLNDKDFEAYIENMRGEHSFIDVVHVATDKDIQHIESMIDVLLPESYIWFIKKYGAGGVNGADINGVGIPEHRYHIIDETAEIVERSTVLKDAFNGKYLLLEEYDEGWVFLLAISMCQQRMNEAPVVAYNTETDAIDPVWNTFCDFIKERFGFYAKA